jgi:transcriptional regulator with XRE-family HTH domain
MHGPKTRLRATDTAIGRRVAAWRKAAGLSQQDLGDTLGVTFQQIQKYETGKNRVSSSALIVLAKALGTTPETLMGDSWVRARASAGAAPFTRTAPLRA